MPFKSKPIIGLPCAISTNKDGLTTYVINQKYITALIRCNASPVLLPIELSTQDIQLHMQTCDGFMLSGGGDLDPAIFNGEPHERVYGIDPLRDTFEISLVKVLMGAQKPLMTICRGTQVLNVAMGGSLYTDIASQVPDAQRHDWFPGYPRDRIAHQVHLEGGSILQDIFDKPDIPTNSLHHQAIKDVGEGLKVTAIAPDGIIEGLELPSHPFLLGVQWHPEWLQDDPRTMKLFQAFVDACK